MKKIFLYIVFLFFIFNCASKSEIMRKLLPFSQENTFITNETIIQEKEKIKVTIRYMDTTELQEMAEEINPNLEDNTPLFTAFKIIVENKNDNKIFFDINNVTLDDGFNNKFHALTYESFKIIYPSSIYQKYEYTFVFDRYFINPQNKLNRTNSIKTVKTLFKGNKIPANSAIEGIIPFERISERAKNITLQIQDIISNIQDNTNNKQKENKINFTFQFHQKIIRLID